MVNKHVKNIWMQIKTESTFALQVEKHLKYL